MTTDCWYKSCGQTTNSNRSHDQHPIMINKTSDFFSTGTFYIKSLKLVGDLKIGRRRSFQNRTFKTHFDSQHHKYTAASVSIVLAGEMAFLWKRSSLAWRLWSVKAAAQRHWSSYINHVFLVSARGARAAQYIFVCMEEAAVFISLFQHKSSHASSCKPF